MFLIFNIIEPQTNHYLVVKDMPPCIKLLCYHSKIAIISFLNPK